MVCLHRIEGVYPLPCSAPRLCPSSTQPLNINNANNEAYRETVVTALLVTALLVTTLLALRQVVQVFPSISENSE
jgi:hypothetical protein